MEPLHARCERGVLTLTLDTPGSDVNVFDLRAAHALAEALETLAPDVEAVVLASTKPGSFVNGVGLMMAGAAKVPSDVARLTEPVRRAYRALRNASVPTIAAIRGNCFGCGVELALQCSHRVAAIDGPTAFYMTEIADYLFVPCFGATQDLPQLVGLDAAIRLLVHGERWGAREALQHGLVDRAVPLRGSDEAFAKFVDDVRSGHVPAKRRAPVDRRETADVARVAVRRMPPAERVVCEAAIDLLERGAAGEGAYADEIEAAGASVVLDASKAAQAFFFVRQIASVRARRGDAPPVRSLVLAGLPRLARLLRERAPADLAIVDAPAARFETDRLLLASSRGPGVDVVVSTTSAPARNGSRPIAWAPMVALGVPFVEIDAVDRPDLASQLAVALHRAGFESARARVPSGFATRAIADALLDPIFRFLARGGRSADVERTTNALGFSRSPRTLAFAIGRDADALDEVVDPIGSVDVALSSAISASLVATTLELLTSGEVEHPSTLDVIARHVLSFPLSESSLCRFASVARARALLKRPEDLEPLVDASALARLEDHATRGRDLYR